MFSRSDVGGLAGAKDVLDEALIFPQKHPELFKGKRQPWYARQGHVGLVKRACSQRRGRALTFQARHPTVRPSWHRQVVGCEGRRR